MCVLVCFRWLKDLNYYGVSLIKGIDSPETASAKVSVMLSSRVHVVGGIWKCLCLTGALAGVTGAPAGMTGALLV